MFLKIKKIAILLAAFCFWAGCTQVKQVVTDVKEDFQGIFKKEKADTQKAPAVKKEPAEKKEPEPAKEPEAADKGTPTVSKEEPASPAKAKKKETKTTTPATKKGTTKTAPTPSGEIFGPK
ncbi:MAG: hypothetical protein HY787_12925 [Deltaproteobacteria bacterium]|nr:hypothetical protein [Deltaproteobacteria bacterium]